MTGELRPAVIEVLDGASHVLLDVDGVLCLGDEPLLDAATVLAALSRVARVVVTTNDSRRSLEAQRARLVRAGVGSQYPLVQAADAVVARLRAEQLGSVALAGTDGLRAHLVAAGIEVVDDPAIDHAAVVTGCVPDPTSLDVASFARRIGERVWLATNLDATVPTPDGPVADTGAVIDLLAPLVGRRGASCGKPSPWMRRAVEDAVGPIEAAVVIGDGIATDLAWARAEGWPCIHVADRSAGATMTVARLADVVH